MKIDNTYLHSQVNAQKSGYKVDADQKSIKAENTKPVRSFSVKQKDAVKPSEKPEKIPELFSLLSAEEKQMFGLLFPSGKKAASEMPAKTYAVQKRYSLTTQTNTRKILGNNLDIRG